MDRRMDRRCERVEVRGQQRVPVLVAFGPRDEPEEGRVDERRHEVEEGRNAEGEAVAVEVRDVASEERRHAPGHARHALHRRPEALLVGRREVRDDAAVHGDRAVREPAAQEEERLAIPRSLFFRSERVINFFVDEIGRKNFERMEKKKRRMKFI